MNWTLSLSSLLLSHKRTHQQACCVPWRCDGDLTSFVLCLANGSPRIQAVAIFNVTVGVSRSMTVTTTDPDGDSVNLQLITTLPTGASFDNVTGVFTWTPGDVTPVNIS